MRSPGQREALEGDAMRHDEPARDIAFRGGPHPFPSGAECSCCYGPAPTGVCIFPAGTRPQKRDPYVFICVACARRIAEACP
jgi:hypothetical protein